MQIPMSIIVIAFEKFYRSYSVHKPSSDTLSCGPRAANAGLIVAWFVFVLVPPQTQ